MDGGFISRALYLKLKAIIAEVERELPVARNPRPSADKRHDYAFRVAVLSEDIDQGATGDVVLYELPDGYSKGSETAMLDTTNDVEDEVTVEAYNRFGDLVSGQECIVIFFDGAWEIIAAGCE